MCTVTIIPEGKNGFVLTSNRDEAPNRVSIEPDFYIINGVKTMFPKDEMSGGTWIGLSEKNRVICVLNGGFERHKRELPYRKSRGVVAKDFLVTDHVVTTAEAYNFEGIEPFTMVIIDWNDDLGFYEMVWDGVTTHFKKLPNTPRIWSSSTLYSEAMKTERLGWFESFKNNYELNGATILEFHKIAGAGNKDFGVIMDRGFVKTTSITQVTKKGNIAKMHYENLQDDIETTTAYNFPETVNG